MVKRKTFIITVLTIIAMVTLALYVMRNNRPKIQTEEELLAWVRQEKNVSQHSSLYVCGNYYDEKQDSYMFCIASVNENADIYFYAMEWEKRADYWKFVHNHPITLRGMDEYIVSWSAGYIFLSGNPKNTGIQIRVPNNIESEELLIPVESIPFSYYFDFSPYSDSVLEYEFIEGDK